MTLPASEGGEPGGLKGFDFTTEAAGADKGA